MNERIQSFSGLIRTHIPGTPEDATLLIDHCYGWGSMEEYVRHAKRLVLKLLTKSGSIDGLGDLVDFGWWFGKCTKAY